MIDHLYNYRKHDLVNTNVFFSIEKKVTKYSNTTPSNMKFVQDNNLKSR